MVCLSTSIVLVVFLLEYCAPQSADSRLRLTLETIAEGQNRIVQKFDEQQTMIRGVESKMNQLKLEVENKLSIVEAQVKEQQCASREQVESFQRSFTTVSECSPPAQVIAGLGCVIPESGRMSWDDAQEACGSIGGRLLEGIREHHLEDLKRHFLEYLERPYAHIGVRGGVYVKSRAPINSEEDLWGDGNPNGADKDRSDCGQVYLSDIQCNLIDYDCSNVEPSLCHILY